MGNLVTRLRRYYRNDAAFHRVYALVAARPRTIYVTDLNLSVACLRFLMSFVGTVTMESVSILDFV